MSCGLSLSGWGRPSPPGVQVEGARSGRLAIHGKRSQEAGCVCACACQGCLAGGTCSSPVTCWLFLGLGTRSSLASWVSIFYHRFLCF